MDDGTSYRRLCLIPIVHSAADLGSLAADVQAAKSRLVGEDAWQRATRSTTAFWQQLQEAVERWPVEPSELVLFQDSLPVAPENAIGIERKIVEDLAGRGSQNHQILLGLLDRGARLEGTESAELLLEEYRRAQAALERLSDDELLSDDEHDDDEASLDATGGGLLEDRDRFIAKRIDKVLCNGEIGVLFIGLMHAVEPHLPADINVDYPFGKPQRPLLR